MPTAASTTHPPRPDSPTTTASTTSEHHPETNPATDASNAAHQDHDGSSKPPTPGYAATANSPTTPTAPPPTDTPHSHSPSPCSSSTESPAPNTPPGALSANPPDTRCNGHRMQRQVESTRCGASPVTYDAAG